MPDTTEPDTLAKVYACYRDIAPEPKPDSPYVVRDLTRRLLLSAIRRDCRLTAAILNDKTISTEDHAALLAEFAAAYLLQETENATPAVAEEAAQVIAGVALDGSVGEWVRQHAQSLGIDVSGVDKLAEAEAALRGEKRKAEAPEVAALTERAEKAERALAAKTGGRQVRQLDAALRGLAQIRERVQDMAERDWADVGLIVSDVIAEVNEIAGGKWMAGQSQPKPATDAVPAAESVTPASGEGITGMFWDNLGSSGT